MTETPNKRPGRKPNPRWDAVPVGLRLTLSECAKILGITRNSLQHNYIHKGPSATHMPDGIEIVRDGRTVFIHRTK